MSKHGDLGARMKFYEKLPHGEELPPFSKITNKVGFLFEAQEPVTLESP